MIDWLRSATLTPEVEIGGRMLPVALRRNARARRLTLRLAPDGSEVRVTLPKWCASRDALAFVHARTGWLAQQLDKLPAPCPPAPGGSLLYRGEPLTIDWSSGQTRSPRIADGLLVVGGPPENLATRIRRWLGREALRVMGDDLAFYADRAGIPTPTLRLTSAQRRWGSCSTSGTVRINWRLIQAPDHARRSVVAHEVAHCLHFDHSPAFHAALERLFEEDITAADAWIKAHGRTLYAAFG